VTALGASFSPRRARGRGLDWQAAFRRLLDLELSPIRLSTYWDEVDGPAGYGELDWLIAEAEGAGRGVVLTVGMKAQGWPEFAIPDRLEPVVRRGGNVVTGGPELGRAAIELVEATVARYRGGRAVVAWQIENEPVNRSGPRWWWIGADLLGEEIAAARATDPTRPIVLNAFAAFNARVDVAASRFGLRRLLGRDACRPEFEVAGLLQAGDVLGLDVYRRIGYRLLGRTRFTTSRHWRDNAARWHGRAGDRGLRAWVIEAQAEPWEPDPPPGTPPRSCTPEDMVVTVRTLRDAGYDTILLWGVEHWLAREAAGDDSWLRAVERLRANG
jgi:hypothetical protein